MTRLSKKLFFLSLPLFLVSFSLMAGGLVLARSMDTAVATKVVHGRVLSNGDAPEPVANTLVTAHRVNQHGQAETLTDADGEYEMELGPGLWALTVEPISITIPGNWIYPHGAQHVAFHYDDKPETYELNFSVILADAAVFGIVEMPDGSVPPFTVTVGLHNGEGLGNRVLIDPTSGEFEMALPNGRYDITVHPHHDSTIGPHLEPVHLPPGETIDLGTITLIALNGTISGTVTDNHGSGVAGLPVTAWQRDRPHVLRTQTGPNGLYALSVFSGTWHVQPAPGPDLPYFYTGEGQNVPISAGETISGVNFEVIAADANIVGILVDGDQVVVNDLDGWATAVNTINPDIHNGAPIRQGQFNIHIPGGEYLVSTHLPPGSPYFVPAPIQVAVGAGETVTIHVPLEEKDAAITGGLVDPRQDHFPVTGVAGTISAWSGDHWAITPIRPEAGTYELGVTAGIWHLSYDIDDEDYVKLGGAHNIPVQSGQTVHWPLPVTGKDAAIAGQVLAPNGEPLPGAMVVVDGLSGVVSGLWLRTRTDDSGYFRLRLPHGRYRVGATGGESGWINPVEPVIGVEPDSGVENIILKFQEPNATISGTLTVLNTGAEGNVLVWAWSEGGGFTYGRFPVTQVNDLVNQTDPLQAHGRYHLGVISGTTWHVGAVFETENASWAGRDQVYVAQTTEILNLELNGPHPKPPPVVVTFEASEAQRLTLADGTEIFIPAGAMPVEGQVTLRIVPIATLPHQRQAHIIQYGYAFFAADEAGRPIEEHFNHNVLIRFQYDEADLDGREHRLKPAYFSTTTNQWTFPENYVIDRERNVVTMEIDHFTNFALVENPAEGSELYLPAIMK